jgi:hypothetical protein
VTEAADFIDAALQYEVSPYSFAGQEPDGLVHYGTSVGAVRGTVRDARRRHPAMAHDEITALASELWSRPVFERRQAAIVLLQTEVVLLVANDLTRLEGFLRSAASGPLVDQLVSDVLAPMIAAMDDATRARVQVVFTRWVHDPHPAVRSSGHRLLEAPRAS